MNKIVIYIHGRVAMQKNQYIMSLFLVIVMWLVLIIPHNFHGKQKENFPLFLI